MIIQEEMEKTLGQDAVTVEGFTCAPYAFLDWLRGALVTMVIAVILCFLATRQAGTSALLLSLAFS